MSIDEFEFDDMNDEFYSVMSIQLGELIEHGLFDWENDETLVWDYYTEEQYQSVCQKFVNRFYYRDIGILPVGQWRLEYVRKLNEIMPKYKKLYELLDELEDYDILTVYDEFGRTRKIDSDFPATMLGTNQDFATYGTDTEFETIRKGDYLEKLDYVLQKYPNLDLAILEECETLFSSLWTVNINGF